MGIERDENGVLHVIALSGGHDSTALALLLNEREPRPDGLRQMLPPAHR